MNARQRHVCHVTTVHRPDDVRIYEKQARSLAEAGFRVTIVAPADRDAPLEHVVHVAIPRARGRAWRVSVTQWHAYRAARRADADLYHVHDPELLPLLFALRLCGRPVVFDAHEDLPAQVQSKPWIPRSWRLVATQFARLLVWLLGRAASGIVAATPTIEQGFTVQRIALVQNFPRAAVDTADTLPPYATRARQVVFVGGLSNIRGLTVMLDACRRWQHETPAPLVIAGDVSPAGDREAFLRQVEHDPDIRFLGWRSRAEVDAVLAAGRVGLVIFQPVPNHVESQPNKLFEYMAAGLPVVASAFPLWRNIVEPNRCGILVDPTDASAVAAAVSYLLARPEEAAAMGERGRQAVAAMYRWESQSRSLVEFYERLLVR